MLTFAPGYLTEISSGGWRRLARLVANHDHCLAPGMIDFAEQMMRRKARPTIKQLSLLLSLMVNIQAQKILAEMETAAADDHEESESATVVPLKP
jgi:hypothetical protein